MKPASLLTALGLGLATMFSAAIAAEEGQPVGPFTDFKGKIELDVRDSVADWGPFTPKRAPEGAPNILIIL